MIPEYNLFLGYATIIDRNVQDSRSNGVNVEILLVEGIFIAGYFYLYDTFVSFAFVQG